MSFGVGNILIAKHIGIDAKSYFIICGPRLADRCCCPNTLHYPSPDCRRNVASMGGLAFLLKEQIYCQRLEVDLSRITIGICQRIIMGIAQRLEKLHNNDNHRLLNSILLYVLLISPLFTFALQRSFEPSKATKKLVLDLSRYSTTSIHRGMKEKISEH